MANNKTQTIVEPKESTTIIEKEIVVKTTKLVKEKIVDIFGGKVQIHTEGYADGDKISVTVNGKTQEIEITGNLGIFCSGYSFTEYPKVKIND